MNTQSRTRSDRPARVAWIAVALAATALASPASGGEHNVRIAREITQRQRERLRTLSVLMPGSLSAIERLTTPERIERIASDILQGNLAVGSRALDANGRAHVHRYLDRWFGRLEPGGLEVLGTLQGTTGAPVPVQRAAARAEHPSWQGGSRVVIGEETVRLDPLWPNGSMPSLCPADGITGPLVYVGSATWKDLRGLELDGAVAVMDFSGGRKWITLASLGCQAVIVVEDDAVNRTSAVGLFAASPIPVPRFYVDATQGRRLIERATRKTGSAEDPSIVEGGSATVFGGHVFEERPFFSPMVYLPPTEPVRYTVRADDLLRRLAAEYGTTVAQVRAGNNLGDSPLSPGVELVLGERGDRVVIERDALLERIAVDFGLESGAVARANDLDDPWLEAGRELVIPNLPESMVLAVPISGCSVAPEAPHGAKVAVNLATALSLLEYLVERPGVVRRKGLLVAFLDADELGGVSSRALAEYVLLNEGGLRPRPGEDPAERIDRYRQAVDWLEQGRTGALSEPTARWLVEDWLAVRVETQRVELAERRKVLRDQLREARRDEAGDRDAIDRLRERIEEIERVTERLTEWRGATLEARWDEYAARARGFFERAYASRRQAKVEQLPMLSLPALESRIRAELAEEAGRFEAAANNRRVMAAVMGKLHPPGAGDGKAVLGWWLDLTDATHTLSVKAVGVDERVRRHFRLRKPIAHNAGSLEARYREVLAYAAGQGGWERDWLIATEADRADFAIQAVHDNPCYPEMFAAADVSLLAMGTQNDNCVRLDTPWDTLERTNLTHVSILSRSAVFLLALGLESPMDSQSVERVTRPKFGRLTGKVTEFNVRSGIDAQDPVPGTYVYYPATMQGWWANFTNTDASRGVRRGIVRVAPLNGIYTLPVEQIDITRQLYVYAHWLDARQALFTRTVNQATVGSQKHKPAFKLLEGEETQKKLILAEVYPLVFFPGPDPRDYLGTGIGAQLWIVSDVARDGEPRSWALDIPRKDYHEWENDAIVLYATPGRRVRVVVDQHTIIKIALVGELDMDDFNHKGDGYLIGPRGSDRNVLLPMTHLHIARDMYNLCKRRREVYERFGIRDRTVRRALHRARQKYDEARARLEQRDYQASVGSARQSWGILINAYKRVLGLGRDAVFSVVLLMALLLPASSFLEKLLIGSKGIVARLVGTGLIFAAGTAFLNFFHPAFRIAVSPFIIVIAFVMILMSAIVLMISYQRFEVILRRARSAGGEVEGEEISLASSLATALSLGVSNLKKRPARTFLTVFTVTVLTFSIVTFVSVRGEDRIDIRPLSLDRDAGGKMVDPIPPRYTGVMFRSFYWQTMRENFADAVRTEFGGTYDVSVRGHYQQVPGGNQADREGVNQEEVVRVDTGANWIAQGIMAFEPAERRFSGLHEAVSHDAWFRAPDPGTGAGGDRFSIILPDNAAGELGITEEMIFRQAEDGRYVRREANELPVVRLKNRLWTVVGILDVAHANRIRDINGKSLAMVDYLRSAFAPGLWGDLASEPDSVHLSWEKLVIVPLAVRDEMNIPLRSVVVRLREPKEITVEPGQSLEDLARQHLGSPLEADRIREVNAEALARSDGLEAGMTLLIPGDDPDRVRRDIALRINHSMIGQVDGKPALITRLTERSVSGLAKIIVPVILCVLIVLNTMMANVEERRGEVGMLGAIGLSPAQISFLLLSESAVFSVMGIVVGTFGCFLFSNVASDVEALSGLTLNFTTLWSMSLAMATGVVVLLATLVPARKAAALAAPSGMARWALPEPTGEPTIRFDLPFTLTRGNAVGMIGFLRRFLMNHTDPAAADFNCRDVDVGIHRNGAESLAISARMWLQPYDLDVAQGFQLHVVPTPSEGVFGVRIRLDRTSGTEEAWLRTNYAFMDLVRHQFLLWRNLPDSMRRDYIAQGAELLDTGAGLDAREADADADDDGPRAWDARGLEGRPEHHTPAPRSDES